MNWFNTSKSVLLFVVVTLFFYSCNKDNDIVSNNGYQVDEKLVEEIINLPSYAVSPAYKQLNPAEKVYLWEKHLNSVVQLNTFNLEQIEHINVLQGLNSLELFEKVGSTELEEFMDNFADNWIRKATEEHLFTREEIIKIATIKGIGKNIDQYIAGSKYKIANPPAKCECRYSISCGSDDCDDNDNCKDRENEAFECGILGTSRCTGRCGDPQPQT